jgi:hypothetical protein
MQVCRHAYSSCRTSVVPGTIYSSHILIIFFFGIFVYAATREQTRIQQLLHLSVVPGTIHSSIYINKFFFWNFFSLHLAARGDAYCHDTSKLLDKREIETHAQVLCKRLHTSAYVSIRQHASAYASIRQHVSAYVSMRQHTSAYVSIRQHTSAYVNMRQHTSTYVSIRQLLDKRETETHAQVLRQRLQRGLVSRRFRGLVSRRFSWQEV